MLNVCVCVFCLGTLLQLKSASKSDRYHFFISFYSYMSDRKLCQCFATVPVLGSDELNPVVTLSTYKFLLWPPYVIRQAIIFLPCGFFLLLSSFFPHLISAVADWMSTILPHMMWP